MDLNTLSVVNPCPERLKGPALLHDLVQLSSEVPALEHLENDTKHLFTYAQLHSASDAIAHQLQSARRSSAGSFIVPVLHTQSPGLYAALLGILKAGGAFCPLNLDIPAERLQFILKDVSATVAVVASELRDTVNFPEHVQIISISALDTYTTPTQPDEPQKVLPTDLAYVMYTSGSTGVPKGVGISHDAATQALMAHDSHVPSFERFFQFAAPTFDVSVFEIFFPLSRGKTLVSATRAATLEDLALVLRTMEVDACELTPTVAAGLLRNRTSVPKLRTLLTIGEMLNKPVVDEFGGSQDQPTMLWAMYGPTEATIHCTLMPAFQSDMSVGTIGFPLQTVSCFILDPTNPIINGNDLNILPRGEIGELAVGGFQLADGYLNRPEQTAAAFITSSYGRIYRTGDQARLNESGILECMGRLSDGQIKLRGQRIELGEIEQAMLNTPKCRVATALVVNSVLVGFCAVEASVTEDDILTKCRQWLPSHMVPSEIVLLDDFPKLPSGKVNKQALRQSLENSERDTGKENGTADQGDEGENEVVQAISKCLNKKVTTNSSLASLGVDSLQAIKLASMLRKQGIHISVADILRARKVSDLDPIAQDAKVSKPADLSPVESLLPQLSDTISDNPTLKDFPEEVEEVLPCTQLQIAMLTTRDDFPAAYHNEMEYEIDGVLSLELLASGLQTICDNNQILRTRFATWQEVPVAIVYASHLKGTVQIETQQNTSALSRNSLSWLKPLQIYLYPGVEAQTAHISIKAHHAIYDGWSMDAVFTDLWNFVQGCNIASRPQFRQIIENEAKSQHGKDEDRRFWADQLTGWSRKTFPTLVEKPSDVTQRATTHTFSLSEAKLKLALDHLDCGTSALFLAALCMVWKGILGSDDFVIGTTTSGRTLPLPGIDEIIGPCIAALPLRFQFERMETSDQLVKYIQNTSDNLMEHAALGLSQIRKLAGLQAFESLYDVLFTFQESLYSEALKKTPFRQVRHLDRLETKLLVEVEATASGFSLQATYHTDVLDQSMADHVLQQVAASFQDMVESAGEALPAASLPKSAALSLYNHPVQEPATMLDLASGFEEVAARLPRLNAIEFLGSTTEGISPETLTYEELNKRSNQVARWLKSRGVQSDTTIAIVMEKSISLYVNILAIIKAGCGYLPLLPSTPRLRVRDILKQARVDFCVIDATASEATAEASSVALLSPTKSELDQFADTNLYIAPDADRLAYVIYTSGTTGKPKGVSVTQQNIVSNVQHLRDTYPADDAAQSRLLQACSQAFDVSVFEIFFSWFAGMCLCSGTNDTIFADIEQTTRTLNITHLSLTPTVASMIDSKNVPSVKFLVTAGEPLTRPVLNQWGTLLWQGYGPSETTNICTVKRMHHSFNIEHLGHTFPNTSVAVLQTEGLSTLPVGWVGELCYGGLQVASGYMGDASLTATKFIDHERYGRLYRSGDLGRMLPDGSLVILGRIDTQVKLRGQRIETAEIDHICSQQPAIHTSTTLLLDVGDSSTSQCLATFFTFQLTSETDALDALPIDRLLRDTLFAALRAHLPSYMIPTYVIPVSRIPRTSSGKCDNRALRSLFNSLSKDHLHQCSQSLEGADSHGEWLDHEKIIRSSLAQSLKVPERDIGRWTSFSAIGLDSISAIHAAASLSRALTANVSISSLLLYPCISLLGQHLRDKPKSSPATHESLLSQETKDFVVARFQNQPEQVSDILPCTPLQEGMLSHGTDNYYNRVLLRLRSHPDKIRECWTEVCRRHDILRTCFMSTHDPTAPIVQVVLNDWTIPWHSFSMKDLSMVTVVESHKRTLPEVIDSKTPPLSLATIRYRGSCFLCILCHHAIYDGTAISILWREIEALVHGLSLPPPVPYSPFLAKTRQQPEDWASFWKKQLLHRDNHLVLASASRETPAQQAIHTATFEHRLDETQKDLHVAQVGLQSLCQGAWAMVLSALTGSQDVMFGNVVSGRNIDLPDIERLVAPCFNTVPIRQALDQGLQNHLLLRRLQKLNDDLLPYQFTALRDVMKMVHSQRLFDTLLLVQQPLEEMDETVWTLEEDVGDMDVPLVCEVTPCPNLNSVSVKLYYDMNVLTDDEVSAICNEFTTAVVYLAKSPFAQVSLQPSSRLTARPELTHTRYQDDDTVVKGDSEDSGWTSLQLDIRDCLVKLTSIDKSEINKSTSFFRLGIDSISAIQLASMLRDKGCAITAAGVMANPTCSRLARELSSRTAPPTEPVKAYDFDAFRRAVSKDISKIVPEGLQIEDVLPCTPLQCAMAASSAKDGNYLNQIKFSLDPVLTPSRMRSAWDDVRRQHHLLRTALIPVSHAKSPFAMVTYSAESLEMPLEEAQSSQDESDVGEALRTQFGKRLQENHHLPPWQVTLSREGSHYSMYLVIHHALYDAVSLRQILDDLASALCGHGVPISANPKEGLAELLSEDPRLNKDSEDFWSSLAAKVVINRFPVLTPLREPDGRQTVTLTSSMSYPSILEGCKAREVTFQALIQAAWTRVLSAYTGEDSVVFGVTFSNRDTEATKKTPLPCLSTLPVIATNQESDEELLESVAAHDAKLTAFRRSSLADVQRWLGYPTSSIFDSILVFQGHLEGSDNSHMWTIEDDVGLVEYTAALEVEPCRGGEVRLSLSFLTSVIPQEQAELIVRQFDSAIYGLLQKESSDDAFRRDPKLFSAMKPQIDTIPTEIASLHDFVQRQAIETPDAPALEFLATAQSQPIVWNYQELNDMGNRVAKILLDLNISGTLVAVHFDKCPEAYFAILGALKAGFGFVALDPSMPKARKEFIMQDSGACCLLVGASRAPDFQVDVPLRTIDTAQLNTQPSLAAGCLPAVQPSSTCYCLYTSGTTGTPKGCEITHENAVQAMMAFQHLFRGRWTKDSRWLQFAALHFDVSILEQYWTWSVGMTMVVTPRDVILDDLAGTISRLRITHLDLTPSLARLLDPADVPTLWDGVFITGGEQLRQEILDVWGPKGAIFNAYGPTEATIGVTTYPQVPQNGRPSNIGRPFLNVGTYVLQPSTDVPVLRGAVGELCIAGKLVGKGYINRADTTRERFPWLERFSERVYRTGDLVRVLSDGSFEFLGRADDQVKLRGQRLELGEIDHVIRKALPQLEDLATIVVTQKSPERSVLVCFLSNGAGKSQQLQPTTDEHGLGSQARAACRSQLPAYMVPTYFIVMPYIPLSINNKAEHKVLRRVFEELSAEDLMSLTSSTATSSSKAGQFTTEKIILALSEFSGVSKDTLRPTSSIFEAGVDSINVLLFTSALRRHGISCSAALVLQNPVLAELGEALTNSASNMSATSIQEAHVAIKATFHRQIQTVRRVLGFRADMVEYIAPCTPLQEGMVTAALSDKTHHPYFVSFELRLASGVDVSALRSAWQNLLGRYAILRTAFLQTSDGCFQVACRSSTLDWVELTTDLEIDRRKATWLDRNSENIVSPLQFTISQAKGSIKLCIDLFHGIYDGISLHHMLQEVRDIHYGQGSHRQAPDFIEAMTHGPLWKFDYCKEFWVHHFRNWSPQTLGTTTASPRDPVIPVAITKTISSRDIDSLPKHFGVTHQTIILALWASALGQHFRKMPTIGLVVGGRALDLAGVEDTIGPLFNTLPFFAGSCTEVTWSGLISHCHQFSSSILSFQHVPLRQIQKWCSSGQRLLNNLLTVQPEEEQSSGDALWKIEEPVAAIDYPLALEATIMKNGDIQLHLVADGYLATQGELRSLLDYMEASARSCSDNPSARWTELLSLTEDDAETSAFSGDGLETKVTSNFQWSPKALRIRQSLANLASCQVDSVGAHTSLLELGLDSIDVLRLSSNLRSDGVSVAPSTIIRCQTIANLMPMLHEDVPAHDAGTDTPALETLQQGLRTCLSAAAQDLSGIEDVLPATPLQEGMVMAMFASDFQQYFNHEILKLRADLEIDKLHAAWNHVVQTNPILRTGFAEVSDESLDSSYCQVVHNFQPLNIPHDRIDAPESLKLFVELARVTARQSMGFDKMLQVRFASCGTDNYMVISIAHALYDGWSLDLLYDDLQRSYEGSATLRPSPQSYLSRLVGTNEHEQDAFWEDFLHKAEPTILDSRFDPMSDFAEVLHDEAVSTVTADEIGAYCKKQGVSLQVLCYACWALVLARQCGQLDVSFGAVLSGRDFEGADELMFPTMNTVAQRCIVNGTRAELLSYIEQNMRDIRPRQSYPLRKALSTVSHGQALFDSIFMMQKSSASRTPSSEPMFKPIMGNSETDYPICAESELNDRGLVWRMASRSQVYRAKEVAQLLQDLDTVLYFMLNSPGSDILVMQGEKVSICGLDPTPMRHQPAIDGTKTHASANHEENMTWSPQASAIAQVLSAVSHVPLEDIKPWNSIYHLGLDSITTIKLSLLLKKKNINIRPRDLLRASGIMEMASMAEETATKPEHVDKDARLHISSWTPPPDTVNVDKILARHDVPGEHVEATMPALPMQIYMIRSWYLNKGSIFFPEFRIRLPAEADPSIVSQAWEVLRNETPLLRTMFYLTGSAEVPLVQVVMKSHYASKYPAWVRCWIETDGGESQVLVVKIHHALYDAFSLPSLVQRLLALCSPNPAAKTPYSLAPWIDYTVRPTLPKTQESKKRFWKSFLGEIEDGNRPPSTYSQLSETRTSYVDSNTGCQSSSLRRAAAAAGTSVQALFLAACAKTTAIDLHGNDFDGLVVLGMYFANRDRADILPRCYPTLSIIPIKVKIGAGTSLISSARQIQHDINNIGAQGMAEVGLWEIYRWTGVTVNRVVNFIAQDTESSGGPSLDWLAGQPSQQPDEQRADMKMLGDWSEDAVTEAYPAITEIEASLNEESLTVGVFGPQSMVTNDQALEIVHSITSILQKDLAH